MRQFQAILILTLFFTSCGNDDAVLQQVQKLNYPSASAVEYINDRFFVMGDDANHLLILDSNLVAVDSIPLYNFPGKRIPKSVKPDLEGITVLPNRKLLLTGSGSLAPYRNIAWLLDPSSRQKDSIRLDTFCTRLLLNRIEEINIEGLATIPGWILLSNRGNKSYRRNQLIFTRLNFLDHQAHTAITTALLGYSTDSSSFQGVSGMDYAPRNDRLIITVSTEDTRNNFDDGAIGKSYIWIVKNIAGKRNWKAINPDKIIDLENTDPRFKGQKIESVCVVKESKRFTYLLLAADNDEGSSTLFKLVVPND